MNVQISEIKLIELFIEVDDFFNAYLEYRNSIGDVPRNFVLFPNSATTNE